MLVPTLVYFSLRDRIFVLAGPYVQIFSEGWRGVLGGTYALWKTQNAPLC